MAHLTALSLDHLRISSNRATEFGRVLSRAPLPALRHLSLQSCRLTGTAAAALITACTHLTELRCVSFADNALGFSGVDSALAALEALPQLTRLDLRRCNASRNPPQPCMFMPRGYELAGAAHSWPPTAPEPSAAVDAVGLWLQRLAFIDKCVRPEVDTYVGFCLVARVLPDLVGAHPHPGTRAEGRAWCVCILTSTF